MRSTVARRPQVGLATHFHAVTGSAPVTRLPVSVSPNPGEGQIGSNEAFQPRAPVASQRAELPALRDGELVVGGTHDQQQTRGWQPLV